MTNTTPLERAQTALAGLSVGDAFGQPYEYISLVLRQSDLPDALTQRQLPQADEWLWTDDTNMAASIVRVLRQYEEIDANELAADFARRIEPKRGYGMGAWEILTQIQQGADWEQCAEAVFDGTGSYGNGAAMRIAPLGAYFADDLAQVVAQARLVSRITHTHPEGLAGGIAVAVAAAIATQARANNNRPAREDFITAVIDHTPASEVHDKLQAIRDADLTDARQAAHQFGSGYGISAQDTVPYTIWCAGTWLDDYEEALWQTLSGLGDTDTVCAIVGGIVACYTGRDGIPDVWLNRREPLPAWIWDDEL